MYKNVFQSRKNRKINKIKDIVDLKIDYNKVDKKDIYGYYILNRMEDSGVYDLAMIGDFHDEYPDYIALFNQPGYFQKTKNTCIAFYIDDEKFDDLDGLYIAIISKNIELLKYYKWYFKNVKYVIGPDYSVYGNFKKSTIIHQLEKETIVIGWLVFELGAIVYPNITYGLSNTFDYCFGNIYYGSNVAISFKGSIDNNINQNLLKEAIKTLVDTIKPKAIIVYTVSSDKTTNNILEYAILNNIKIIIPDNSLRSSNMRRIKNNG